MVKIKEFLYVWVYRLYESMEVLGLRNKLIVVFYGGSNYTIFLVIG